MKYILLCTLISSTVLLFGFDIKAVDLTEKAKETSVLSYAIAEDGKKIYKDIGKTIEALDVKIIYPIDSNKTHTPSSLSEKNKKIESQEEDITNVFTDINASEDSKMEAINNENQKIKLNKEAKKLIPINLEK